MNKPLLSLICLFLFHHSVFALPEDRNQIANFHAEKVDFNQNSKSGLYEGNVEFDQGTTHLRANKVITKGNEMSRISEAYAFGDKANPAHYWEQNTPEKPPLHAYAKEIRYYPDKHIIELLGDARVEQGKDSLEGDSITYNIENKHVVAHSNGKSRIKIIMHPEKKKS